MGGKALDTHCRRNANFIRLHAQLPFATRLAFEEIEANLDRMNRTVIPWYDVEQQSKPIQYLQQV